MKIDWKARLSNPMFWGQIFMGVVVPMLAYFNLTVEDITTWTMLGETIVAGLMNPYVVGTFLINLFGAVVNFDTKGIGDNK